MKKTEMKPYKEMLIQLRNRLRGDVAAMASTALTKSGDAMNNESSSIPSHIADIGSETFEQHNTLRLLDNDGEVLDEIEVALERIEDGVYGACIECEHKIPKTRLRAIPYTPYCVKCASQIESGQR
jgi:RNA polymerase-binding transcription factor DksA